MQASHHFDSMMTRFSRSSSRDSSCSTSTRSSSPAASINTIIFRQPSIVSLEEERRDFPSELDVLEPRPVVFFGSVEERMQTFKF